MEKINNLITKLKTKVRERTARTIRGETDIPVGEVYSTRSGKNYIRQTNGSIRRVNKRYSKEKRNRIERMLANDPNLTVDEAVKLISR